MLNCMCTLYTWDSGIKWDKYSFAQSGDKKTLFCPTYRTSLISVTWTLLWCCCCSFYKGLPKSRCVFNETFHARLISRHVTIMKQINLETSRRKLDETFQGFCNPENRDCNCVDSSFAGCSESAAEEKVLASHRSKKVFKIVNCTKRIYTVLHLIRYSPTPC